MIVADFMSPGAAVPLPEMVKYVRSRIPQYTMMLANQRIARVGAVPLRALKETITECIRHDAQPAQLPPAASGNEQDPPEQPKPQEAELSGSRRQGA